MNNKNDSYGVSEDFVMPDKIYFGSKLKPEDVDFTDFDLIPPKKDEIADSTPAEAAGEITEKEDAEKRENSVPAVEYENFEENLDDSTEDNEALDADKSENQDNIIPGDTVIVFSASDEKTDEKTGEKLPETFETAETTQITENVKPEDLIEYEDEAENEETNEDTNDYGESFAEIFGNPINSSQSSEFQVEVPQLDAEAYDEEEEQKLVEESFEPETVETNQDLELNVSKEASFANLKKNNKEKSSGRDFFGGLKLSESGKLFGMDGDTIRLVMMVVYCCDLIMLSSVIKKISFKISNLVLDGFGIEVFQMDLAHTVKWYIIFAYFIAIFMGGFVVALLAKAVKTVYADLKDSGKRTLKDVTIWFTLAIAVIFTLAFLVSMLFGCRIFTLGGYATFCPALAFWAGSMSIAIGNHHDKQKRYNKNTI